jgi:hypothetical protein
MSTFRLDTELTQDGTLTLSDLPFQAGDSVEVIIVPRKSASALQNGYSLRGKVIRYDNPTEPVAQADWEALQ